MGGKGAAWLTMGVAALVLAAEGRAWTPLPVADDPLVRMPGTQPGAVTLKAPKDCDSCHGGYDPLVAPADTWQGSMMAQAARDPLFWAAMTVAAQDSIWAVGTPNGADLCLRCHSPQGWAEGRSDPPNGSALAGPDFDGVHCHVCHAMVDPYAEETWSGVRAEAWDETNLSATPSQPEADRARRRHGGHRRHRARRHHRAHRHRRARRHRRLPDRHRHLAGRHRAHRHRHLRRHRRHRVPRHCRARRWALRLRHRSGPAGSTLAVVLLALGLARRRRR